tara:strand:- start:773 stop:991 length:219 start_codon:yes stop_codon:yes gene_type:complete
MTVNELNIMSKESKCPACNEKLKVTMYAECAIDCEVVDGWIFKDLESTHVMDVNKYECFYCGTNVVNLLKIP